MIFGKKKITITYTVEECNSCHKENKRKFQKDDSLFSDVGKCTSCEGNMIVEKIFGETIEQ